MDQLDRKHGDDRAVVLDTDFGERLQAPELERARRGADGVGRLRKLRAASCSPSARMMRARFSRIASASLAIARCICSGMSTSLISTESISTPHFIEASRNSSCIRLLIDSAVLQHVVEIALADCIAKRGLRGLHRRGHPVLHRVHDLIGESARNHNTALTLTATPSRVIVSWVSS